MPVPRWPSQCGYGKWECSRVIVDLDAGRAHPAVQVSTTVAWHIIREQAAADLCLPVGDRSRSNATKSIHSVSLQLYPAMRTHNISRGIPRLVSLHAVLPPCIIGL